MWKKIKLVVVSVSILALLFFGIIWLASEKRPSYAVTIPCKIIDKEGQPCFYIDSFDKIDDFTMDTFNVRSSNKNYLDSKNMWVYNALDGNKIIKLSSVVGKENCIKYARKDFIPNDAEKLDLDTLYTIEIDGHNKDAKELGSRDWGDSPEDSNWIEANGYFFISKSKNTNKPTITQMSNSEADKIIYENKKPKGVNNGK